MSLLKRFLPFVLVLSLVLAAISCNDDWLRSEYDTSIQWEGGFEGPLVFGNLNLRDLLEQFDSTGYVSEDSTGLLYAAYSKDTVLSAPEILEIKDQQFLQVFFRADTVIPGWWLGAVGDTTRFTEDKGFKFERRGEERIDSVYVKTGETRIYVRSSIKHEGILTISSDDVFLNGQKYNEVITISDASGTYEQTFNIPMDGATLHLDNSATDSSSMDIRFDYDLINSGNDILVGEEVQIINSFHNLEFSAAFGYIPFDSLLVDKAELEFSLLEGTFEGVIKIANPRLNITTENSMGIPFGIELLDLEAHFKNGSGLAITIDPSANPVIIDAPTIEQVGESVISKTKIDTNNSNIFQAATSNLTGFQYSIRAIANPEGPRDNFILDDSELGINIEGLVPLNLKIQDLVLGDTLDFSIPADNDFNLGPEDIDYMMMRIETDNTMPIDLGIQIYFVDTTRNWIYLDSLFLDDRELFLSGVLDENGRVIQGMPKITEVEFSRTQIEHALDANKMLMKAFAETAEDGSRFVKFYADYSLDFKLGMRVELNLTLEPDQNNK